ncbi:MAG: hypothetical protein KAW12_24710 [Candidatus Aminicenantes bacterium]|nr:hypothetical protein [Candidatus Aminicenantes bacterium]
MNHTKSKKKNAGLILLTLFPILLFSMGQLPGSAGIAPGMDLAAIFKNRLVIDTNNDHIPDDIAARFLIGSRALSPDIEAAAAIAARLGFESCAMDPALCVSGWNEAKKKKIEWLITFSTISSPARGVRRTRPMRGLPQASGIRVYKQKGIKVIDIFGETPRARRYAALNFFSRFPYTWDITGRETGELWSRVKEDVLGRIPGPDRKKASIRITAVHYLYREPLEKSVKNRLLERSGLSGTTQKKGEVEKVEVELIVPGDIQDIAAAFKNLIDAHKSGIDTQILNFAGVKHTVIHISSLGNKKNGKTVCIPRTTVPQRFLNPAVDPFFFKKKTDIKDVQSDIAGFYTGKGIYKDTDEDGFADKLVSRIIYEGSLPFRVIDLCARIGLEDCAVSLPFIRDAENFDMKTIKNVERPIFIGRGSRFTGYLRKIGRAGIPSLGQDEGVIQFSAGFNPGGAYIISGSGPGGENAALGYAAGTLPFISAGFTRPGAPVWQDLNRRIELFFGRKSDAGIAAYGILQLDRQKKAFAAADLESADVRLFTLRRVENLDSFLTERIQTYRASTNKQKFFGGSRGAILQKSPPGRRRQEKNKLSIKSSGRLTPAEGFSDTYAPQWEVDEFREIFTQKVLPKLQSLAKEQPVKEGVSPTLFIDLRLSEPKEVLEQQAAWIEDMAVAAGFKKKQVEVRAICAYKQGFHWIKDHLIPRLNKSFSGGNFPQNKVENWDRRTASPALGRHFKKAPLALIPSPRGEAEGKTEDLSAIKIRFSPFPLDLESAEKYRPEPVRWLQELYPIDEILEKELNIPLQAIHFEKDDTLEDAVYEITVLGRTGEELFKETFTPFTTVIPFQERFKQWGNVTVCTGGIRVAWQDREVFSTTIDTDPLRLWKHYQGKILPKLTGMIEKLAGGPLKLEEQPFFDRLLVKVWMSEPDYRLGLDEELVSSLESFHEDVYFNTLDYFQGLVKKDPEMDVENPLMAQRWAAPGNILPIIHPSRTGRGPLLETLVTGLESFSAKVAMKFRYFEEKKPVKISKKIVPLKKLKAPRLTGIVVDKKGSAREAEYSLEFKDEKELSDAVDMLGILAEMQKEKILGDTFSYPGLSTIRFILCAPPGLRSSFVLNSPRSGINKSFSGGPGGRLFKKAPLVAEGHTAGGKEIGRAELDKALSKVMSPEDTAAMAQRLGILPEIDFYTGGYSFQGRPVPVLEIGLKSKGKIESRRKITTYKPTIFILGRQHANEVSSTNYGFNIAYLLAKDPAYRKYLEQLNIVIEPMENPDGSALAVELQKLTPHHMLHAGRYSALGTDIGYQVNKPNTLITEAKVRKKLYRRWQPDIFLNNHGYPSHEWVQQFSNYTPYLFRAYWAPRGWYYFHVGLNRIGTPQHKKAGERIVEIISEKMKGDREVFETNRRIYDRYRRWAERWQPHIHYLELYDGTNIYKKRRRSTASRLSKRRKITVLEAIPEAMDETARDEWLQLAIRQGTLFVTSFFDLAIEAKKPIERIEEEVGGVVNLQVIRYRPLRVKK